MISTNQFKNGMHVEVDGTVFKLVEFQHVKPGKGGAFVRTNAPPLPGFTCWNSPMRHTAPSSSMCMPFLNWLVLTVSATAGESTRRSRAPS